MSYQLRDFNYLDIYAGNITLAGQNLDGTWVAPIVTESNVFCDNVYVNRAKYCDTSGNITSGIFTILNNPSSGNVLTGVTGNTAQWVAPGAFAGNIAGANVITANLLNTINVVASGNITAYQYTSTATTLPPLIVNSTAQVANLNAASSGVSLETEALGTTGTAVNVGLAVPPTTGQILVATSATTATWQDAGAITGDINPSSITVTGQITSNVTTGTAPFVINSTTVIPNLHAESSDKILVTEVTSGIHYFATATSATTGEKDLKINDQVWTNQTGNLIHAAGGFYTGITGKIFSQGLTDQLVLGNALATTKTVISAPAPAGARTVTIGDAGADSDVVLNTGGLHVITNLPGGSNEVLVSTGTGTSAWTASGPAATSTDALNTATTSVDVSASVAPSSGDILEASSSTAAAWVTPTYAKPSNSGTSGYILTATGASTSSWQANPAGSIGLGGETITFSKTFTNTELTTTDTYWNDANMEVLPPVADAWYKVYCVVATFKPGATAYTGGGAGGGSGGTSQDININAQAGIYKLMGPSDIRGVVKKNAMLSTLTYFSDAIYINNGVYLYRLNSTPFATGDGTLTITVVYSLFSQA